MFDTLKKLTQLDEHSWSMFSHILTEHQYMKGETILQPGQLCKHIFFLQTGLLRSFQLKAGDERNVAFSLENSFLTDLKSLRNEQPSELTIQALEPSSVLSMAKVDLVGLYQQSHPIETLGRNLLETLLEEQEEYASWFTLYSAKERYDLLRQKKPDLIQRLPLGQLASYLGIRRETLSRIRRLK
ncbi:Crp/Fnr family transcriptional regulator [Spirosoma endbachense]|uniref:Cyclic nucleotide-binding domain-containing protein n=1 Tax=Spirosoma endbachense TaxID=2666025 RepID=A0A6P1W004_9BACT|nr:Crp/Fnr family transcriptional regulator [Spirosoma endbachense]QHV97309.1 cyclic nucleotide-binding domain-containing protein [Spirosoma endbachense]